MFSTLKRSWEFTKLSLGTVWTHKVLMVFPVLSGLATILVLLSFAGPLWGSGTIEGWMEAQDAGTMTDGERIAAGLVVFGFYFVNYLVIVFFNSALMISAMRVIEGDAPRVGDGLRGALKRLPQIAAWALVAAAVGMVIRSLENNRKVGRLVVSLLGTAWTAMTFFVVPIIAVRGEGPVSAFKSSLRLVRETWGTALVGTFSINGVLFLLGIPLYLLLGLAIFATWETGGLTLSLTIALAALVMLLWFSFSSAVDSVFKTLLFQYATGADLPDDLRTETGTFRNAFVQEQ
ncbi:MAG: hypothetical protein EA425_10895 [Puniceicoccaceae bacterium]|nr:MAG: hypothetical protein EA425_10895 [Puniceicoccaceae bacterium]